MTPTKVCTVCGEDKPHTDYSANFYRASGLQSACKACRAAWRRAVYAEGRYRAREVAQRRAYRSALAQLRERHIDDFWDLYLAALKDHQERAS